MARTELGSFSKNAHAKISGIGAAAKRAVATKLDTAGGKARSHSKSRAIRHPMRERSIGFDCNFSAKTVNELEAWADLDLCCLAF